MKPSQVDSKLLLDREGGLRTWCKLVATSVVKSMLRFDSSSKLEAPRSEHFAWAKKKSSLNEACFGHAFLVLFEEAQSRLRCAFFILLLKKI